MSVTIKATRLIQYKNGNTEVTLLTDGTKIRECESIPFINFPESIDVKITNYCDMGCAYCHESSTTKGIHGDLDKLLEVISALPAGVELAIGGGNPLSHPDLVKFLEALRSKGLIANITVNQGHLKTYQDLLVYLIEKDLVKGVGISVVNNNFAYVTPLMHLSNNIVFHVIAGVNRISIVDKLKDLYGSCKILILGYKQFGFGVGYFSEDVTAGIKEWKKGLRSYVGKVHMSFDNLAIEQLDIKCWFSKDKWEQFYMGDDFTYTMYIDTVKQEYAPTSRSNERTSFEEMTLIDFFKTRTV